MSQQTPPKTEAAKPTGANIHRRETRRQTRLPMLAAFAFVLFVFIIAALLPSRVQVSTLADWMFTVLVLCPVLICNFAVYMLVMAGIFGLRQLHRGTQAPLQRLENFVSSTEQRVEKTSAGLNKRVINISARLAPLMQLLSIFDSSETQGKDNRN